MDTKTVSVAKLPQLRESTPGNTAAYWLRRDIIHGVFKPLERLAVEKLAEFYGIGLSPIREAILRVTSDGLVVHYYMKGYRVAPVSPEIFEDAIASHDLIHRAILERAFKNRDEAWEERVLIALYRTLNQPAILFDEDPAAHEMWLRVRRDFRTAVYSSSHSPVLIKALRQMIYQIDRYRYFFFDRRKATRDFHRDQREVVDAFLARDFDTAKLLIERNFSTPAEVREEIRARLARDVAEQTPIDLDEAEPEVLIPDEPQSRKKIKAALPKRKAAR